MSRDPSAETPAQALRSALLTYLMRIHGCRNGGACEDCSEMVTEATDEWLAVIQRWGTSVLHVTLERSTTRRTGR
ncbi:MAG: hypothetical protein DLM59_15575 [Pseudonocardiales bacterium]|nr:MAG: hypothetical protein DLM59_15575 [Pseudonocardiales bacterium]